MWRIAIGGGNRGKTPGNTTGTYFVVLCRTIVLRHLAALRPSTASDMKAIVL